MGYVLAYFLYLLFPLAGWVCYDKGTKIDDHRIAAAILRMAGCGLMLFWVCLTTVLVFSAVASLPPA